MNKIVKAFVWSLFFVPSLYAQITLEELTEAARNHHPQQGQMALIGEATDLKLKEIAGGYLPQTSLGGQATWQSEVTSVSVPLPNVNILPPPKDQYKLTLDLQQNLWDGGLTAARKGQALSEKQVQENTVSADLLKVEEQVSSLYFRAIILSKQKSNLELLLADLTARMKVLKAAVDNGVATKSSLLDLQAKELELQQKSGEIDQKEKAIFRSLSLLSGQELRPENGLAEEIETASFSDENKRPEIGLLSAQQSVLEAGEKLVKAKNAPKLGLFATGGFGRPGLNFLARDFSPYFIGGVSLKIPVSHWYTGGQKTELQQLKVNQLRLEKQKESFLLATEVQMLNQEAEVARLEELIGTNAQLIEIREQLLKTAETQLDNGVITSADYLVELNKLEQARQNLSIHEVQLLQAKQNIRLLLGQ